MDDGAEAVDGNDGAGLSWGEAASLREIDGQIDEDEAADVVDERAGEQDPERSRQAAEVRHPGTDTAARQSAVSHSSGSRANVIRS